MIVVKGKTRTSGGLKEGAREERRRTHSISSMPSPVYQWRKALRRTVATKERTEWEKSIYERRRE